MEFKRLVAFMIVIAIFCIHVSILPKANVSAAESENVIEFLESGYDGVHYTYYDGKNENNYFCMSGRKYYQGFTLLGTDYRETQVSFNVENIDSLEMTIGHIDNLDDWGDDKTLHVYRDGEWWQDISLTVHGALQTKKFNVSGIKTLRFYMQSQSRYGFADIKIDSVGGVSWDTPEYESVNDFMNGGYNQVHYYVYDGSNEYNYFRMNGRTYTQGFTLLGTDYRETQVSFNVENIDSLEMTIGHIDNLDDWGDDKTLHVYRDGEWWQDISLTVHGALQTKKFNVSGIKTLRFYMRSQSRYGFADIKIDGVGGVSWDTPKYESVNDFMNGGYNQVHYYVYDGSNEYNYFRMNGRTYTQGFTLLGTDYRETQVSFNVENIDSLEMTIGHIDDLDDWGDDKTLHVYRDGEWWQDISLTVHGALQTKKFNVSDIKTLRFYMRSQSRYGFADIKIDGISSMEPEIPVYSNMNEFMNRGYNRIHYNIYNGSNENNYFSMNGKKYDQGFTLLGTDYKATQVSFNVENLERITFCVGHIDDEGGTDKDLILYLDGDEYYRLPLRLDAPTTYYTLDLTNISTLRLYIDSQSRYGFTDFTFNNNLPSEVSKSEIIDIDLLKNPVLLGDVNEDGKLNVSDVVLLQKWLLAVPDTNLANWQAADLNQDGECDVFDLALLKRQLLQ